MKKALFYKPLENQHVQCKLCPHLCQIKVTQTGLCGVRWNKEGELIAENFGKLCSIHLDPIEKKPLYHYYPAQLVLSVGSAGCNLNCKFCQNWEISQTTIQNCSFLKDYTSGELVSVAKNKRQNIGIAYTYNEPITMYEFVLETAEKVRLSGMKNIMVTNGYLKPKALLPLLDLIDAFNVDLKAFTDAFYQKNAGGKLKPVLNTLEAIRKSDKHLEITNLVIPTQNDDVETFEKMIRWIAENLGKDTVLHLSRYFPKYQMTIAATPIETLIELRNIAKQNLDYVYIGNAEVANAQNTVCSKCGQIVVKRNLYTVLITGLDAQGNCSQCGNKIAVR